MHPCPTAPTALALALQTGCAATIDQGRPEQRTARAIGRPAGPLTIADRSEETGGRINCTATTLDGKGGPGVKEAAACNALLRAAGRC